MHAAYRRRRVALLAGACALAAACDGGRVTPAPASVSPSLVCGEGAATLMLAGSGFAARVDGALGQPSGESPAVALASGGSTVALASRWLSTTALAVDLPAAVPADGRYDVTVINPDGARATLVQAFARDPAPRVDGVNPPQLCSTGGDFTVSGGGFADGATVAISDGASTLAANSVSVTSATQLMARFAGTNDFANNASLDLTVTNPDGCSATLAGALHRKTGGGGCP